MTSMLVDRPVLHPARLIRRCWPGKRCWSATEPSVFGSASPKRASQLSGEAGPSMVMPWPATVSALGEQRAGVDAAQRAKRPIAD